jgi:hypothetical protein
MMEPILNMEHHHGMPIARSSGMAMVIESLPPPETSSQWVGRGLIQRILFNLINRPRN